MVGPKASAVSLACVPPPKVCRSSVHLDGLVCRSRCLPLAADGNTRCCLGQFCFNVYLSAGDFLHLCIPVLFFPFLSILSELPRCSPLFAVQAWPEVTWIRFLSAPLQPHTLRPLALSLAKARHDPVSHLGPSSFTAEMSMSGQTPCRASLKWLHQNKTKKQKEPDRTAEWTLS